jgi:hypothetical protein
VHSENAKTFVLAGIALTVACMAAGGTRRRAALPAVEETAPEPTVVAAAQPPRRRGPRRWPVIAVVAAGALLTGVAIAAWVVSGSGSGYAKAGTASALTLGDASASTTADLYPGVSGSVKLSITNPNAFAVRVTTVTGTGAITSDKGAACNAATGVTFTNQTGLTLDLAAGATTTFTLAGAVSMSNASDNSCQGAIFTIPVSVSGTSN